MSENPEMTPAGRRWVAAILIFFGMHTLGLSFGWIHTRPGSIHAPLWVLTAAGMTFNLAAAIVLLEGTKASGTLRNLVGWLFLLALSLPFNWIAFGAGERHFSGSASGFGMTIISVANEGLGRVGFGIAAAIMDAILLWALLRVLRGKPAFPPQQQNQP